MTLKEFLKGRNDKVRVIFGALIFNGSVEKVPSRFMGYEVRAVVPREDGGITIYIGYGNDVRGIFGLRGGEN